MIEIRRGEFLLRDFPPGRRTVIKPVTSNEYVRRIYEGRSRVNYPDTPCCEAEMWATLVEAGNEEAVKNSLSPEDFEYVMRHYFTSKSFRNPRAFRA